MNDDLHPHKQPGPAPQIKRRTSIDPGDYGNVLVHILDHLATQQEEAAKPKDEPKPVQYGFETPAPPPSEPQVTQQAFDQQVDAIFKRSDELQRQINELRMAISALIDQDRPRLPMRPKERLRQERAPKATKPRAKAAKKPPAKKAKRR